MKEKLFSVCLFGTMLAAPVAFADEEAASETPPPAEETTTAAPADTKPPAEAAAPTEVVAAEKKKVLAKPRLRPVSAARIRAGAFDHRKTKGFHRSAARSLESARKAYFGALGNVTRCAPRSRVKYPEPSGIRPAPAATGQRPAVGQRPAPGQRPALGRRPAPGQRPAVVPGRMGGRGVAVRTTPAVGPRGQVAAGNARRTRLGAMACGAGDSAAARNQVGKLRMAYIRAKEGFAGHGLGHRAALAQRIAKGAATRHFRGRLAGLASPIYGGMASKLRTAVRTAIKGLDLVELTKGNVTNGALDQAAATKVVYEKVIGAVKGDIDAVVAAAQKRLEEAKAQASKATKTTIAGVRQIQTKEIAAAATEVAATEATQAAATASTKFTDRLRKRAEGYVMSVCRAVVRATAARLAKAGAPAAGTPAETAAATPAAKEEVKQEAAKATESATQAAETEVKAEAKKEEAVQKTEEKAAEKTETEAKTEATAAETEEKTQEKAEEKAAEATETEAKKEEAKPEETPAEETKTEETKTEDSSGATEEKKD